MMQVSKRVPFDDPNVLNGVRAIYILSNLIIAAIYLYVLMQVNKKKGMFLSLPPMGAFPSTCATGRIAS